MRTTLAVLTTLLIAPPAAGQATFPSWPEPRIRHHLYWDPHEQQVLMVGHARDTMILGWNGTGWRAIDKNPDQRANYALAYDVLRDRTVIHGGSMLADGRMTSLADTWEWDRRTWRRLSTAGPGVRDHHAMTFDPVRRHVVLFGGFRGLDSALNDTWGWDGRVWKRLAREGPPGRGTHRLVLDSERGVLVLFGGYGVNNVPLNDTWEWNGQRWRQVTTKTVPSPRGDTRMAYDPERRRIVLFGGQSGNANTADTWEYDGLDWTRRDVAGPTLRNAHEMVYDPRAKAVLLFGGRGDLLLDGGAAPIRYSDLWRFDGVWKQIPRPDAHPVGRAYVVNGPYAVGYRVIDHWDQSRSTAPARDFAGHTSTTPRAMPMQVSIWYPAQGGGTPMRTGEYWALSAKSATLGATTDADVQATGARIRSGMAVVLGVDVPQTTADSIRDLRANAVRDAVPATGRFPVLISGADPRNGARLAEYLASHGYVVVSTPTQGTASQQVTRVPVAIETHTRNLETSTAIAATLPFADMIRLGLIGVNFDGLAALTYQMRNMSAAAIVSLDGYETKTASAAALRQSVYYDPSRLQVPYLSFAQDNPPFPGLLFSDSLARELKYAERYAYVVRDMEHAHLLGNLMVYPQLRVEQRLGYEFVWRTIRAFFDGHVKGDTAGRDFMARSAAQNGFPAWLVKTELKLPALPAIPTAEATEEIAMSGNVERLRAIFRQARASDSTAQLISPSQLNLFAFRFAQRGEHTVAIGLRDLVVEAYPSSTAAADNLGNSYRDAGRHPRAVALWERALRLIDADPDLSASDKVASRTRIAAKIRALQPAR